MGTSPRQDPPQQDPRQEQRRVLDAEIVDGPGRNDGRDESQGRRQDGGRQYYRASYRFYNIPNGAFFSPADQGSCLAACVTIFIFFACLGQYGFLAALGFVFFHVLIGIFSSVRQARLLMRGQPFNPWLWRACNWLFSYLLVAWLAGGLT